MSRNIKPQKKTLKEKICIFLVLLGILSIIYFIATTGRNGRLEDIEFIKKDFVLTEGIVTKKTVYKGQSITVKYKVGDKFHEESDGINESDNVEEGDSISLKYSKTKPELMMTIFNEDYGK